MAARGGGVTKDRDLHECETLAEIIDAAINKDSVLPSGVCVDVAWRRLQGVVLGSVHGDWSLCEALRNNVRKGLVMGPQTLLALTKDAAILRKGAAVAGGAAGGGGGGGHRGARKGYGGGQAHSGGGKKKHRGGGGGGKGKGGGGDAAQTNASGHAPAKKA